MLKPPNPIFAITILLTNNGLIVFELNETLCAKRTQFLNENDEQLDVLTINYSAHEYCFEYNSLTDTLEHKLIYRNLIDKHFLSKFEKSSDNIDEEKIIFFTNKIDRNIHFAHFLIEIEELKPYQKLYPEHFMEADHYLYLVPGTYTDAPQNADHYPVKITIEKRNDFSNFLNDKLKLLKPKK